LQGHLFTPTLQPVTPNIALVRHTLKQLSALGLKVSLSEIDAPSLPTQANRFALQAQHMGDLVTACLDVPRCVSINFWDIDDSQSWLNGLFQNHQVDPTLFTSQLQAKPAFTAVLNALLAKGHAARGG
jgi:endo-1,4-beta-xylanase